MSEKCKGTPDGNVEFLEDVIRTIGSHQRAILCVYEQPRLQKILAAVNTHAELVGALIAAEELIAHSPGCNERYYGRDQTCNCGFYETKQRIRTALANTKGA